MSHVCASDDDKKAGRGHLIRTKATEMLLFFLQILIRLVKKYKQDADQKNTLDVPDSVQGALFTKFL